MPTSISFSGLPHGVRGGMPGIEAIPGSLCGSTSSTSPSPSSWWPVGWPSGAPRACQVPSPQALGLAGSTSAAEVGWPWLVVLLLSSVLIDGASWVFPSGFMF